MKFSILFSSFLLFFSVSAFIQSSTINKSINLLKTNKFDIDPIKESIKEKIKKKTKSIMKLIRYKNILPTTYLFLTGSFLIDPTLKSKYILPALFSTLSLLSSSMVINDLFDIQSDKINNPTRPLITREIKIYEAIFLFSGLIFLTEILNTQFLHTKFDTVIYTTIVNIFLYTPFFKKITFIKNISCAAIVTFSIFFGAFVSSPSLLSIQKNYNLLSLTMTTVFLGSLYNEILLDISDCDGDKKARIYTVPVLFGKNFTYYFLCCILKLNIYGTMFGIFAISNNYFYTFLFYLLCVPIFNTFYEIKEQNYKKNIILNAVETSSKQLLFILGLISFISTKVIF